MVDATHYLKQPLEIWADLAPDLKQWKVPHESWLTASNSPGGRRRATQAMPEHRRGARQRDRGEGPLIERVNLDNLTKERVQEAMMDMTIDGRHPIEFKNEFKSLKRSYRALEQELQEYRRQSEEEKRRAEEEKRRAEEEKRRAEEAQVQAESLLKKNEETVQQLVKEVGALRQELEKMKSQKSL